RPAAGGRPLGAWWVTQVGGECVGRPRVWAGGPTPTMCPIIGAIGTSYRDDAPCDRSSRHGDRPRFRPEGASPVRQDGRVKRTITGRTATGSMTLGDLRQFVASLDGLPDEASVKARVSFR